MSPYKSVKILDIGAGTGLLGEFFQVHCFININL